MSLKYTGKEVAARIYSEIRESVENSDLHPRLRIVLVGEDPASRHYAGFLVKMGRKYGIDAATVPMPADAGMAALTGLITELNTDPAIHAIMVQKPLPAGYNDSLVSANIAPAKDVDCQTTENLGRIMAGEKGFLPCTAAAVIEMLDYYRIDTAGKHVVVIGRSNTVGKPLANLLLRKGVNGDATVTVCHSRSSDLPNLIRQGDIVVAALGKPLFVKAAMVKPDAVLIDVGVNEVTNDNGEIALVGDVDAVDCEGHVKGFSPVPGGVGSVTTAYLLRQVVDAAREQNSGI